MSVTEAYMQPGSFSVKMGIETPELMSTIQRGGYLVITDQRLGDPRGYTDAGLRAAARYVGIVLEPIWEDRVLTLEGAGLDWLLGDLDNVGWPIPARTYSGAAISSVVDLIASGGIIPPAFSIGSTVTGGFVTKTWTSQEVTCKVGLMQVMEQTGNHYRINSDSSIETELSTLSNLYKASPDVVFVRDNHGADAMWVSAPVRGLRSATSIREWLSGAGTDVYAPTDTALERIDTNTETVTRDIAGAELDLHEITTPWDLIDTGAAVGDMVYVYDPGTGFTGFTTIQHRGEWLNPAAMRINEATWPVVPGMGVYYRPGGSSVTVDDWVELTNSVEFDSPDAGTYLRAEYKYVDPCQGT